MKDILRPILELSVVLPGLLLAYFPVKSYLKQSPGKLAARILPLMAGLCIGAGIICYQLHASTASALAGITLLAIGLYTGTLQNLPLEIRNNCTDCLRSICMHQQLVPGYQCYDCSAYAAATGRTVVLPCSLCIL